MIVRETDSCFVMTTQHDHAVFAGEIANGFKESLFIDDALSKEVVLAVEQHDRGWIRLDDTPIWNDRTRAPFSFMDYPLLPKLVLYRLGLDEVEEMSAYAALLCSLHYSSFKLLRQSTVTDSVEFIRYETERQKRIRVHIHHPNESIILRHFKLLQLCDEISLFVCMNEPGVAKEHGHPWYREGFETTLNDQKIIARWTGETEINIDPFLFKHEMNVAIQSKHVPKDLIRQKGIDAAYKETRWTKQQVSIRPGNIV